MKTTTLNLYTYAELSDKAKAKALNEFNANNNEMPFLEEYLKDDIKQFFATYGITVIDDSLKLLYSLSNCQGDGLCFTGHFNWKDFTIEISHHARYYHSRSTDIEMSDTDGGVEAFPEDYEAFKKIYLSICEDLERNGYQYIEEERNEESFISACESNDYTFEENGTMRNTTTA